MPIEVYGISTSALPQTAEVDADDCKVRFGQKRTFPPGPQASSGGCRPGHRVGSDDGNAEHLSRSNQGYSIIQENLPVFGPDTESQSRLKVDQQKCAVFGSRKKRDGKTLETYFGWPVSGSADMRVV